MSEDLIKRSDAIDVIEETDWYHINREGKLVPGATSDGEALYKAGDVYKALRNVPSEDKLQGEWIVEPKNQGGFTPGGNAVKSCSNCGWIYGAHRIAPDYNFCPNCGADMRKEGE